MSSFGIKLAAVISMLIDHAGGVLGYTGKLSALPYRVMRSLGRIAFPLYAFLLVNGFEHSCDREKYLKRLVLFSSVSQIPYSLALTKNNYLPGNTLFNLTVNVGGLLIPGLIALLVLFFVLRKERRDRVFLGTVLAAYLFRGIELKIGGIQVIGEKLNVFYTLASALALLMLIQEWREQEKYEKRRLLLITLCVAFVCYVLLSVSDYGIKGALLVLLFYYAQGRRLLQTGLFSLWCLIEYPPVTVLGAFVFIGALLALIPIFIYNGEPGRKTRFFYYVYPAHLLIYAFVGIFIL